MPEIMRSQSGSVAVLMVAVPGVKGAIAVCSEKWISVLLHPLMPAMNAATGSLVVLPTPDPEVTLPNRGRKWDGSLGNNKEISLFKTIIHKKGDSL